MSWVFVDNQNQVAEYVELPTSWRSFSNFNALVNDTKYLASLGWYPLEDHSPALTNPGSEYYGAPTYQLNSETGVMVKVCAVYSHTDPGVPEPLFQEAKQAFLEELRRLRNLRLTASDWTQLNDVVSSRSQQWVQSWAEYRQFLRDLPQVYNQSPFELVVDIDLVIWPQKPEQ